MCGKCLLQEPCAENAGILENATIMFFAHAFSSSPRSISQLHFTTIIIAMDNNQQQDAKNERISVELLMRNNQQLDKFQTVIYIVGGIISGILGLTGLEGLALYVVLALVTSVALLLKTKFQTSKYTDASLIGLATNGLTNYAMSFVLFWTFAYALVHIY